ncbi:MAG: T9SS type A sorting domain-containing protein, partial [Bacteroidetes bacterium]|nr:T9SS type A sorting domain-containing protein [Bacteroidota bacterium]
FVEWGSAGNGRESVAVAKGIWGEGDFISTSPPYQHTGSGAQNGVTFWQSIITALPDDIVLNKEEIVIYPNPFEDFVILTLNYPFENKGSELLLVFYDLQGREKRIEHIVNDKTKIMRNNLPNGTYFLVLRGEKEIFATRKIVVN